MSAVKRVEKLLKLADKRLVQSARTIAQSNNRQQQRGKDGGQDEIGDVAAEVERVRRKRRKIGKGTSHDADEGPEEVVIKATGKAIQRGLELGQWFCQRDGEYVVRIKTGSVKAIDDVQLVEVNDSQITPDPGKSDDQMSLDTEKLEEDIPETRVRYTSVLEVRVSLL
nr:hypothetical protein CFP56_69489 [Quercus suber]